MTTDNHELPFVMSLPPPSMTLDVIICKFLGHRCIRSCPMCVGFRVGFMCVRRLQIHLYPDHVRKSLFVIVLIIVSSEAS